jgi:hypothetical protein
MGSFVRSKTEVVVVNPVSGERIEPMAQPGYYPGYSTLSQQKFWDEATRKVVLDRVEKTPPIRFFSPEEAELMKAICDSLLPQDDRDEEHKVAILPYIDQRLFEGKIDGYRYESMPPDRDAYQMGLKAIQEIAQQLHAAKFEDLTPVQQGQILKSLHDGKPEGTHEIWKRMPAHRFFMLMMQDCVEVYYAHPWAWDEIGYGGPAYPRAYMRLENGQPEPWEKDEMRYEWSVSDELGSNGYEFVAGEESHHGTPGQGGTH